MHSSDPLHVAFVWHMHQPYYRLDASAPFDMPWVRMHALKDYLDMVEILSDYPDLHQTFNLVPSLVEQLETYARDDFADVYWQHTLKPAADLEPAERAFVVERMCESSDHPRARSHPRYLELARKREAQAAPGWAACASSFGVDEIRDLQVWFNLAWFDPQALESEPLSALVARGGHFAEEDKGALDSVQRKILTKTLPAYRAAAAGGQIEISTSPYFHPILPLLANTDSARVAATDTLLPRYRFAHPEDAREQLRLAFAKHEQVFGAAPRGVWCSEQAVGEDVIPMLLDCGFRWTISDETVLARSLAGVGRSRSPWRPSLLSENDPVDLGRESVYSPFLLRREGAEMAIVFRDHTLSDLIGFAYNSWGSRDAAADFLKRLREIRATILRSHTAGNGPAGSTPLVTVALDGENAWEYYPRDGRDFLQYLYEGLSSAPEFRCLTVSEHLDASPPVHSLDWLHTGSWIGGDLRTWIGDSAHGAAWELLHQARDEVSAFRLAPQNGAGAHPAAAHSTDPAPADPAADDAWRHILAAEGSDWFWWFGDHHHTELDSVWDLAFRRHLQEAYRSLGREIPLELLYPLVESQIEATATPPAGPISPVIDGTMGLASDGSSDEWSGSGRLAPALPSTMQRAEGIALREVRYGWKNRNLCVLIAPETREHLEGLEVDIGLVRGCAEEDVLYSCVLQDEGYVQTECKLSPLDVSGAMGAWKDVIEILLPVSSINSREAAEETGLVVRIGRDGMVEHVFHSARLGSQGWGTT